ncbi:glycosyltransferase family 39 protein [Longispora sp. K20-0274]|uniref:glycosyltransferase family 39 protein n=1 Tax=Longispora sp. K20-0274 TaxID=3088255 RepID=UPI003999ABFB
MSARTDPDTGVVDAEVEVEVEEAEPAATPAPARRWWRRALVLLGALVPGLGTLALGLYGSGRRDMWNDELITWHATRLPLADLRRLIVNIDLYHTFYYLLMHPWVRYVGDTPTLLRLPAACAMALTAVLIVLIGRRLVDTPVGLTAGLLFAVLPPVSRYAQEARSYGLVVLGATLATWLLLKALDRSGAWWWTLYGATVVMIGWLHFVSLGVLVGHAVWVLLAHRRDDRRWDWVVTVGTSMLVVIPLFVMGKGQASAAAWIKNDLPAVIKFPRHLFGSHGIAMAVVGLALLGVLFAVRRYGPLIAALTLWALIPPLVGYATGSFLYLFLGRYYLFTLPAWCLLAALGACQVGRALGWFRVPALWPVGALLGVSLVACLGVPAQQELRTSALNGQPGYADAYRYVRQQAKPTDGIAFNDGFARPSDLARKAWNYESRAMTGRPRDVFLDKAARQRGWLTATECPAPTACLGDTARIWLVETGNPSDPFAGLPKNRAALLKDKFTVKHVEKLNRIRVIQLERKKP